MMEAVGTSETSANFYRSTRRNIPEEVFLIPSFDSCFLSCAFHKQILKPPVTFFMSVGPFSSSCARTNDPIDLVETKYSITIQKLYNSFLRILWQILTKFYIKLCFYTDIVTCKFISHQLMLIFILVWDHIWFLRFNALLFLRSLWKSE
jgi:hypothetical protein